MARYPRFRITRISGTLALRMTISEGWMSARNSRFKRTALLAFKNPTAYAMLNFGRKLKYKSTWSNIACPQMTSQPFCLHKSLITSPNLRRTLLSCRESPVLWTGMNRHLDGGCGGPEAPCSGVFKGDVFPFGQGRGSKPRPWS